MGSTQDFVDSLETTDMPAFTHPLSDRRIARAAEADVHHADDAVGGGASVDSV